MAFDQKLEAIGGAGVVLCVSEMSKRQANIECFINIVGLKYVA